MPSSGNFCTLNPLAKSSSTTLTKGNLYLPSVSYPSNIVGTMGVSTGKWYFEARCENNYGAYDSFGIITSDNNTYLTQVTGSITGSINWTQLSEVRINGGSGTNSSPSYYNGNTKIVGCAFDLDNNKVYFHGNGSYVNSDNPSTGTGGYTIPVALQGKHFLPLMGTNAVGAPAIRRANFGQDSSFGNDATAQNNADGNGFGDFYYAPPTGFLALCSGNYPEDDILTSTTFVGNGSTSGPYVNLGGVPGTVTINSNAVTFGTHALRTANGFRVISSSSSYNNNGATMTVAHSSPGASFKYANAQSS